MSIQLSTCDASTQTHQSNPVLIKIEDSDDELVPDETVLELRHLPKDYDPKCHCKTCERVKKLAAECGCKVCRGEGEELPQSADNNQVDQVDDEPPKVILSIANVYMNEVKRLPNSRCSDSLINNAPTSEHASDSDDDNDDDDHSRSSTPEYAPRFFNEEEEEVPIPPVKKTKVKPSHSRTVEQPGTSGQQQQPAIQDPIGEEPPPENFFTIKHLICPNCPKIVFENELNAHMLNQHSIERYRCLFKNCRVSFAYPYKLAQHNKETHGNTVNWECDKCDTKCPSNKALIAHYYKIHKLGLYVCSFPKCKAENKSYSKAYTHYTKYHKEQHVCQHSDCNFKSGILGHFKEHRRTHTGNKPYQCNWSRCQYADSHRRIALKHIEDEHFGGSKTIVKNGVKISSKYYLKIVKELM